eukprot:6197720-Pleurochrysis_carterae.AAC.3
MPLNCPSLSLSSFLAHALSLWTAQVDPKELLNDGVERELVAQLIAAMQARACVVELIAVRPLLCRKARGVHALPDETPTLGSPQLLLLPW